MSKHTPGPWTFYEEEDAPWTSIWIDSPVVDGESVCLAKLEEYSSVTMRANAALIAAAPDLLKLAEALVQSWEACADGAQAVRHNDGTVIDVRKLIARATGEP